MVGDGRPPDCCECVAQSDTSFRVGGSRFCPGARGRVFGAGVQNGLERSRRSFRRPRASPGCRVLIGVVARRRKRRVDRRFGNERLSISCVAYLPYWFADPVLFTDRSRVFEFPAEEVGRRVGVAAGLFARRDIPVGLAVLSAGRGDPYTLCCSWSVCRSRIRLRDSAHSCPQSPFFAILAFRPRRRSLSNRPGK